MKKVLCRISRRDRFHTIVEGQVVLSLSASQDAIPPLIVYYLNKTVGRADQLIPARYCRRVCARVCVGPLAPDPLRPRRPRHSRARWRPCSCDRSVPHSRALGLLKGSPVTH